MEWGTQKLQGLAGSVPGLLWQLGAVGFNQGENSCLQLET